MVTNATIHPVVLSASNHPLSTSYHKSFPDPLRQREATGCLIWWYNGWHSPHANHVVIYGCCAQHMVNKTCHQPAMVTTGTGVDPTHRQHKHQLSTSDDCVGAVWTHALIRWTKN